MITVAWLSGTGWGQTPDGVSREFARHLDPDRFEFLPVAYPADFGTRTSYTDSVLAGRKALADAVRATPHRAVIGGYSQGAYIAGSLARDIADGRFGDLDVLACALIADPARPRLAGLPGETPAPDYGISGERHIGDSVPTYWAAVPDDPITSLPEGSLLRALADITEYMTISTPEGARAWADDLIDRALRARWQPAHWFDWRAWTRAADEARRYLPRPVGGGRHDAAYIELGLCARLAQTVNREVRP
ncbi:PE-PPE domain-containing protein [Nocardia wallacei]|uniref:PE-PPE domain-containing protein n=1 Tax=Nocardia wallacei TaxID=480035 RepID=UPI002453898F|nr:PE-PPE domain-containing protein [Nocardia wallacei]